MPGLVSAIRSFQQDPSVVKQRVKPETAKRMLGLARPYAGLLALLLFIVILDASTTIANPLLYRATINDGILKGNALLIVQLAILVALLGVFDSALGLAQSYLSTSIGAGVVLSLRTKLFEHIQRMPMAFFVRTQTGALVSRLNADVGGAKDAFTDILSNAVGNAVTVAVIGSAMFFLCWQITLAALVLLPCFLLAARVWGRKLQEITRESYDLVAAVNSLMVERFNVAGAQLAKLYGHRKDENRAFVTKAARVSDIGVKRAIYGRLFYTALTLMAVFATALAYGWGGVLVVEHRLDVGTVVAFVSCLVRLYSPIAGLSNIQVTLMTALVSFDRVFEVLDLKPMIQEKPDPLSLIQGPMRISFDHVSFQYPSAADVTLASLASTAQPDKRPGKSVLHDITFVADPGQLVALVGPSGAGKTTITQLVPRLYDVQSGVVAINGLDVRELELDTLQQRVGVVTQDCHLFHDTIRANLLYAKPDATDAEVIQSLRAAQILPLIESLPKGLDTIVGERGYRFSGGEKQRLAIARLLLKSPEIVILDEATAHLDSESEVAIQRAFDTALRGRTSIVIAHRLSTILKADQILVVQEGQIVERGKHIELLERNATYAELYRLQFAAA